MNLYNTSQLVEDILLMGHMPLSNSTFDAQKVIRLADLELQTPLLKQILSTRGGYYLTYADYETSANGLYVIPSDCVAGALANVELIQGPTIVPVNLIAESEQFSTISPTSTSYGFFLRGNFVQILPTPNVGTTRLWYFKRPSQLIQTVAAGEITLIVPDPDIETTVFTVTSVPSTFQVGTIVDVLGDQPPFNILGNAVTITDITGTDITIDAIVDSVTVGDWIALHNQTPVPQIPVEYRILLSQRVVCKIYELQNMIKKWEAAKQVLKEYEESTLSLITPRVQSQSKVISPSNGGFLQGGRNRYINFPAGRFS